MKRRPFGAGGPGLPVIGQGTWELEREPRRRAVEALRAGLDAGMTHVDTAEMYGDGTVEELVAEALEGRRDEVFLVSKVLPENASRAGTRRACEASLRRLKTDRLDSYLLHWAGPHPLAETVAAFEELVEEGKILSWGVSNFDEHLVRETVAIAGPGRVACNQVLYHLGERGIEHEVIPACHELGVAVVAYSPFGSGDFPRRGRGHRALAEVARRHGATPRQVALAFLVRGEPLLAIPRTSRPEHARDNAAAGGLDLEPEDVTLLDQAFPLGPRPHRLPTL